MPISRKIVSYTYLVQILIHRKELTNSLCLVKTF